jgi:hemoglobin
MTMQKPDIENAEDISHLVDRFYSLVLENPVLKPYFTEAVKVNWEKHLPVMKGFWEFILFSTPNAYTGSMMAPHFHVHEVMPLTKAAFEAWIATFKQAVDELFEGTKAEDAKNAAFQIGATMRYKILGSDNKSSIKVELG